VPDNKFSFDIQHDISKPNENQFQHVKANKELWSILLDLILDNANIHAFDTKSEKNKVHIQLTSRLHNVQVQIKNNGKPFPKNFDQKAFVTKYKTHEEIGSGIGGSDIDQIMKFFGDYDWELKLDAEAYYPVVFQFSLNYSSFSK
jgi:type I restriction enzyme M protein